MSENNVRNDNGKFNLGWISLVPIIGSVLGYTLAYIHEAAFCNVFFIPNGLITLNWNTILLGIAAASSGVLFVGLIVMMLIVPRQSKTRIGPIARRFYLIFVVVIAGFLLFPLMLSSEILYLITYVLLIVFIYFILPLFSKIEQQIVDYPKLVKAYSERLKQSRHKCACFYLWLKKYRKTLTRYDYKMWKSNELFTKNITLKVLVVILIIGGAYSFAFLKGRSEAMNQKAFYVLSTSQSIVLRIYGEIAICAPYNMVNEGIGIERQYFVIKLSENPNTVLSEIQIQGKIYLANPNIIK